MLLRPALNLPIFIGIGGRLGVISVPMRKIPFLIALIFGVVASQAQEEAIRNTYSEFDARLLAKEGDEAVALLSADSQEFVGRVRDLANTATEEELLEKPLPVILAVFSVRSAAEGVPPESLAETLIDMSRGYAETSAMTKLGPVTVEGNTASGEILVGGKPNPIRYSFVFEDGAWKVDMAGQMEETEAVLLQPLEAQGISKAQFLSQIASAMNQQYSVDVLLPLNP